MRNFSSYCLYLILMSFNPQKDIFITSIHWDYLNFPLRMNMILVNAYYTKIISKQVIIKMGVTYQIKLFAIAIS